MATKDVIEGLGYDSVFPRIEIVNEMKRLHGRRRQLVSLCEEAERRLTLASRERNAIEALGSDPEKIIRERKAELETLNREAEQLKQAIYNLARAEVARFTVIKNAAWNEIYHAFIVKEVGRLSGQISNFCSAVDAAVSALDEKSTTTASPHLSRAAALDSGAKEWNEVCRGVETAGNLTIRMPDNSLLATVANSLRSKLAKSAEQLQVSFNLLAAAVNLNALKTEREWREKPEAVSKMRPPTDGRFWPIRIHDESSK